MLGGLKFFRAVPLLACFLAFIGTSVASAAPDPAALIRQGHALIAKPGKAVQLKGAKLLERGWALDKGAFDGLVAAARACFIRAYWETDRARAGRLSKRGWKLAARVIKGWPDRAEGYYWAAVNIGRYATTLSVMDAVNQGVVGKIERHALAALKRDPTLYKGGTQIVLGRYYFQLPWPMKKLDKAVAYLRDALKQNPDDAHTHLYLGEALEESGERAKAHEHYRRCAARGPADPVAAKACAEHLASADQ